MIPSSTSTLGRFAAIWSIFPWNNRFVNREKLLRDVFEEKHDWPILSNILCDMFVFLSHSISFQFAWCYFKRLNYLKLTLAFLSSYTNGSRTVHLCQKFFKRWMTDLAFGTVSDILWFWWFFFLFLFAFSLVFFPLFEFQFGELSCCKRRWLQCLVDHTMHVMWNSRLMNGFRSKSRIASKNTFGSTL